MRANTSNSKPEWQRPKRYSHNKEMSIARERLPHYSALTAGLKSRSELGFTDLL